MPKFNPSAAKLIAVESYFTTHQPITAHSIKDLEKSLPTATGISAMQVKDYLTALVDENKIRVEKIGSGNWYWCFKGDEKKQMENEVKGWEKEVKGLEGRVKEVKQEIEIEGEKNIGDSEDKVKRATKMKTLQFLSKEKAELEKELALYAENDPVQIDRLKELLLLLKTAANEHTNNIYAIDSYLKSAGMVSCDITSFKTSLGIPEEIEEIE
ncbi:hypothetical protein AOL_s00076g16 [Orbilia oligospora ATCC 24927]|uniref:Meiotic nuclear division protein 1 n=1 Tax=Arthrobotrys oligospora (strain ATCC 24927 / CBS 115.81 / DSM 1491) TaxID=756982 RepID=G1X8R0_ARTOA|nr:hypothetical protein AOL_s00076g16 [Orbilia oligospora ATCC 24927]EGX50466.1 hypothetical protein AOL_s00076g16 [Orbilia oligospora ATCC 24927]